MPPTQPQLGDWGKAGGGTLMLVGGCCSPPGLQPLVKLQMDGEGRCAPSHRRLEWLPLTRYN